MHGPHPQTMADALHQVTGKESVAEKTVEDLIKRRYGKTVLVHCAPIANPATQGNVSVMYRTMRLTPAVCNTITDIIANPAAVDPADKQIVSNIYNLSHEISHTDGAGLRQERDEGVTSCLGAQRSQEVAEALGIPTDKANTIGSLAAVYANKPPRPEYAIPAGCEDGGRYDINAPGGHFPFDPVKAFVNGD